MCAGGEQKLDAAVAEEIVIAIDQDQFPAVGGIVERHEVVALNGGIIVAGLPFRALDDDGHGRRDELQAADVVPVQVGHDLLGQCA